MNNNYLETDRSILLLSVDVVRITSAIIPWVPLLPNIDHSSNNMITMHDCACYYLLNWKIQWTLGVDSHFNSYLLRHGLQIVIFSLSSNIIEDLTSDQSHLIIKRNKNIWQQSTVLLWIQSVFSFVVFCTCRIVELFLRDDREAHWQRIEV